MTMTAPAQKRGYSMPDAVHYTGCTRTSLYEAIAAGRLRSYKVGRRRFMLREDLDAFIDAMIASQSRHPDGTAVTRT